jgi:hypothetical protein
VLLASDDGASVELRLAGYLFRTAPAAGEQDWDANWLVIDGDVHTANGESWQFTEPCLTTWDVRDLAAWLR